MREDWVDEVKPILQLEVHSQNQFRVLFSL